MGCSVLPVEAYFKRIFPREKMPYKRSFQPAGKKPLSGRFRKRKSGHRFYSAEIGRWLSRDVIQEWGGWNLYGFMQNNGIMKYDVLGKWPGWTTCVFAALKSDTGWVLSGYAPTEDYASAGTSGGGMSDGVIIVYGRTIEYNYTCTCYCPSTPTTKVRTRTFSYTYTQNFAGGVEWVGIPGTWPPLSLTDAIASIVIGDMTSGIVGSQDISLVEGAMTSNTPALTTAGTLVSDSGVPTRFCLWL